MRLAMVDTYNTKFGFRMAFCFEGFDQSAKYKGISEPVIAICLFFLFAHPFYPNIMLFDKSFIPYRLLLRKCISR